MRLNFNFGNEWKELKKFEKLSIEEKSIVFYAENIASIIFTTTSDVFNEFPAVAAREILSLHSVPLLNMQEIDNPNGLNSCIRILIHWNTDLNQDQIKHVYLNGATVLRTDLK